MTVGANVSDMGNMTFDMQHWTLDCVFLVCLTNTVGVFLIDKLGHSFLKIFKHLHHNQEK